MLSHRIFLRSARQSGSANEALRLLAILEDPEQDAALRALDLKAELRNFGEIAVSVLSSDLPWLNDALSRSTDTTGGLGRLFSIVRALLSRAKVAASQEVATGEAVAEFVTAAVASGSAAAKTTVRRLLATTNPEWLEPLGRALDRAFHDRVPLASQGVSVGSILPRETMDRITHGTQLPDGVTILTHADRVGRLLEVLRLYEKAPKPGDSADFTRLVGAFAAWRSLLDKALRQNA